MKKGSLILVLRYHYPPYFANIVEIDLNKLPETPTVVRGPVIPPLGFECVARLKQGGNKLVEHIDWKVCSLSCAQTDQTGGGCTPSDLCVFTNSGLGAFTEDTPVSGYIFNFRTGAMEKLKPPKTPKLEAFIVSLKGDIYSFSDPSYLLDEPNSYPERYCHEKKSWKTLEPFPLPKSGNYQELMGYAVFDDDGFILFNTRNSFGRRLLAYDCSSEKWHVVTVHDRDKGCYAFQGLGVVVETTLYALTTRLCSSILALSITRELSSDHDGDDVVVGFSCCLRSEFMMSDTCYRDCWVDEPRGSDHLVHLGGLQFCLVRTGFCNYDYDNQVVKIMVVELNESLSSATLIHKAMDYYDIITLGVYFRLCHCFLLPPSDLDHAVSKSGDNDFTFDVQNVNPALEAKTPVPNEEEEEEEETIGVVAVGGNRRRRRRRRKGSRRQNTSGKSMSSGGDDNGEGSRSQMGSK